MYVREGGQENASVGSVKSPCAKRPEIGFRLERRGEVSICM